MKQTLLIRHGESLANAGIKTDNYKTLPLTEKGKEQAEELAKKLDVVPELIIVSPYTRAQETAKPFIEKHMSTPVETWDVYEFTYLDPDTFDGTTYDERQFAIINYWENAPIDSQAGDKAESFIDFIRRVENFVIKLKERTEKEIVIFTHGVFIYTLQKYLACRKDDNHSFTEEEIRELKSEFKQIMLDKGHFPIENASVHRITL